MEFELTEKKIEGYKFYGIKLLTDTKTIAVDDISTDKAAVEKLAENIALGDVTETTLMDIIQDFIE